VVVALRGAAHGGGHTVVDGVGARVVAGEAGLVGPSKLPVEGKSPCRPLASRTNEMAPRLVVMTVGRWVEAL
jgi:hypothetical protein